VQNASADTGASRNSSALPGLAGLIREGEKLVNCCPFRTCPYVGPPRLFARRSPRCTLRCTLGSIRSEDGPAAQNGPL
jgi:hypothetical protein